MLCADVGEGGFELLDLIPRDRLVRPAEQAEQRRPARRGKWSRGRIPRRLRGRVQEGQGRPDRRLLQPRRGRRSR